MIDVNAAIADLQAHASEFAQLAPVMKSRLLRACIPRLLEEADKWVKSGCHAKRLTADESGEEWLTGPVPTLRMMRLLAENIEHISENGKPPLGTKTSNSPDGRLRVHVFPASIFDRALFYGFDGYVLMKKGISHNDARALQACHYSKEKPSGGISVVLGAGNVSSIPPMDVLTKMFIEGNVTILKLSPVNEWVGTHLQRAFRPLIDRGYLRIVYGDGDTGKYLVENDATTDVHITGSEKTHDLIVWGPEGNDRDRRLRDNEPKLKVPILSELGNITPIAIVPHEYSDTELEFQANNIATMLCNNASFNCNAAKLIIVGKNWSQRDRFFDILTKILRNIPTRNAYYPGAFERYHSLVAGRTHVQRIGIADDKRLPWTLIRHLDANDTEEPLFRTEPFCSILSETQLECSNACDFLRAAVAFMNNILWGTLAAGIIISPQQERDPTVREALENAISDLRYGCIAINHWPALAYGLASLPWGGHPSANLQNIQSGLGWVHNTYMLEGIEKCVIRGNLHIWPTPIWFANNSATRSIGPKLARMEADPSWSKIPGLILRALWG